MTEPDKTMVGFCELPEDMQVLLADMTQGSENSVHFHHLLRHVFHLKRIPVSLFPREIEFPDYRGEGHAQAMMGHAMPPIVVCGDCLLDGRHRVWAARHQRMHSIPAIDLAELGFVCTFEPVCRIGGPRRRPCLRPEE